MPSLIEERSTGAGRYLGKKGKGERGEWDEEGRDSSDRRTAPRPASHCATEVKDKGGKGRLGGEPLPDLMFPPFGEEDEHAVKRWRFSACRERLGAVGWGGGERSRRDVYVDRRTGCG